MALLFRMTNNLYKQFILIKFISTHRLVRSIYRSSSMDTVTASANWRGVPLSEILGSQSPWGAPEFPLVSPSHNHTVLYHIPSNGDIGDRPPKPQRGQDKWDNNFVRMPCSNKSLYPFENSAGETQLRKRWEMIEEALRKPILNSHQLADTILSYNTKFKSIWKFRTLHALFLDHLDEEVAAYFFTVTLPQIAQLALDLPKLIQAPIPLLKQHKNHSISLTQHQIASLLANAFFCTFPRRNTTKRTSEYASYPHINFSSLYECRPNDDILEKLTCLCHYFRRVCTKAPVGVATFSRRSVSPRALPVWSGSAGALAALPLHVDPDGHIEDADGLVQMDFANKYLGGGVLGYGSVQEEIRFAICPELMVSMLFTEVLRPNEALFMIGCERYSDYTGYGRSFRWAGDFGERAPRDSAGRRRVAVLAVDALPYADVTHQYRLQAITRELNKAWVGFSFFTADEARHYPGVATGNWGCGAFGGSPQLKWLVQLMAAAHVRRPLAYYTFGDVQLRDDIVGMYDLLARHNVTVGQLYEYIVQFCSTDVRRAQLPAYLRQVLHAQQEHTQPTENMDISTESPKPEEQHHKSVQRKTRNISPDLFSLEEDLSQKTNSQPWESGSVADTKINNQNKMVDNENKMAPQTKRLFEELEKFDNENGKLNLCARGNDNDVSSQYFNDKSLENALINSDSEIEPSDAIASSNQEATPKNKAVDNDIKVADSGNEMTSTSRLFDEMQKFDDEHGRLNCNIPSSSSVLKTKLTPHDSDASMESDKSEVSSEIKKKITRKITDYFSKKSTS